MFAYVCMYVCMFVCMYVLNRHIHAYILYQSISFVKKNNSDNRPKISKYALHDAQINTMLEQDTQHAQKSSNLPPPKTPPSKVNPPAINIPCCVAVAKKQQNNMEQETAELHLKPLPKEIWRIRSPGWRSSVSEWSEWMQWNGRWTRSMMLQDVPSFLDHTEKLKTECTSSVSCLSVGIYFFLKENTQHLVPLVSR